MQTTSLSAYSLILPTLGDKQATVLTALMNSGGLTNKELSEFLGWDINRVTPRVNELVKKGLVCEVEKRTCMFTKHTAIAWGIVQDKKVDNF